MDKDIMPKRSFSLVVKKKNGSVVSDASVNYRIAGKKGATFTRLGGTNSGGKVSGNLAEKKYQLKVVKGGFKTNYDAKLLYKSNQRFHMKLLV